MSGPLCETVAAIPGRVGQLLVIRFFIDRIIMMPLAFVSVLYDPKRFKITLFLFVCFVLTKHNMGIFGINPFICLDLVLKR